MKKIYSLFILMAIALSGMSVNAGPLKPFDKSKHQNKAQRHETKRRAAEPLTVVDESFSKFTQGSETDPVTIDKEGYYIPDNLTNQPGWAGRGIAEAGGACAVLYYDSEYYGRLAGFIDTPEMYLFGETTLTFKAKAFNATSAELWVPICDAYDGPMDSKTFMLTDQWQEFSFTTSGATAYDNNYFQFTPQDCEVLLDDIKIVVVHNKVQAPYTFQPENISLTSFKAVWESIVAPDGYKLNVYSKEPPVDFQQGYVVENFNGINVVDDRIDASNPNYPEGWTISTAGIVEKGIGDNFASTGLVLSEEGEFIESATMPLPITGFSFWIKPSHTNLESYAYSLIQVSIYRDNDWEIIANLPNFWLDGNGAPYAFDQDVLGDNVTKIKLEYYQKGDGEVAFTITDFYINYQTAEVKVPFIDGLDLASDVTSYVVEGLVPEKDYYYTVQSVLGDLVSQESYPWWVDGINGLSPVALEATNITSNSFTANWEAMPHASNYTVRLLQLTTALEDMEDVTVIEENFDKITEGTLQDPGWDFISPFDFGANGMANADWQATQARWIVGMAGSAGTSWYGSAGIVASPYLTLTNDGGAFDVEFTAMCTEPNDVIFCMLIDDINATQALDSRQINMGAANELKSTKVHFNSSKTNRKNVMVAFMTMSGTMFFIDDVRVSQNLKAGEAVVSFYQTTNVYDTSHTFVNLPENSDYVYSVTASGYKEFVNYFSEPSNEVRVNIASSVGAINASNVVCQGLKGAILVSGLAGSETLRLVDMQGRVVVDTKAQCGDCTLYAEPGMYIIAIDGKTEKVMVK